jgi:hypothetical protein
MSEHPSFPEPLADRESVEQKKERLRPAFLRSQQIFRDPERPLREGAMTVEIGQGGEKKIISGLVALEVSDDGVELGTVEEDGEIGPSGFLAWEDLIDAK